MKRTLMRAVPALILSAALLAACVSRQTYDALQQKYDQMQAQLTSELSADQAQITLLQGELKVTLKNELLFPEGGWKLNAQAKSTLSKLVPSLVGLQQTRIVVNGYTDNVPIGPGLRAEGISDNLDLSSRRADQVVSYLISQGVNADMVSAQGFGDAHPVASNDTPEGRAQNRRIDLTLVGPGT